MYGTKIPKGKFILGIWFMIPESPRWLISVKKFKEAKSILMEAGKQNGKPLSKEDLSGISQHTDIDGHSQTFSQYILKVFQYKYSILPKNVLIYQYFNTFEIQKVLEIPIHQYF